MTALQNPTNWVVAGDSFGVRLNAPIYTVFEVCTFFACSPDSNADQENCPWTQQCGLNYDQALQFAGDQSFQKRYIRHLGGVNLAFADGHAQWWNAYALFERVRPARIWDSSWANPCPLYAPEEVDSIYGFDEDCTFASSF
jgi:prepilin-type processing-associated H-X9-DG protein